LLVEKQGENIPRRNSGQIMTNPPQHNPTPRAYKDSDSSPDVLQDRSKRTGTHTRSCLSPTPRPSPPRVLSSTAHPDGRTFEDASLNSGPSTSGHRSPGTLVTQARKNEKLTCFSKGSSVTSQRGMCTRDNMPRTVDNHVYWGSVDSNHTESHQEDFQLSHVSRASSEGSSSDPDHVSEQLAAKEGGENELNFCGYCEQNHPTHDCSAFRKLNQKGPGKEALLFLSSIFLPD